MKVGYIKVEFEDDFQKGVCRECPIYVDSYSVDYCALGCKCEDCPIEFNKNNVLDRKWISVSDKLPTSSGRFEVTIKGCNGKHHVEMCNFNKDSELYKWGDKWNNVNVIAWRERDFPYWGD